MQRDPKTPQEIKEELGKCPASPELGTLGSYQDRGWAPISWCGHWGGCLGPSAPPATHSPPQGLGPASLTYFRPARDKGGLSSSAQAEKGWEVAVGGHGQPVGPPHLWPYSLGNPQGLVLEKLWSLPRHSACSEVPISPYTRVREPPEKGLQETDCEHPLANLS